MWESVDLFQGSLCRPRPDAIEYMIPVSPLRYIAADPRFTFGGTKGSCERITPNNQHKLEFLVGTLAS